MATYSNGIKIKGVYNYAGTLNAGNTSDNIHTVSSGTVFAIYWIGWDDDGATSVTFENDGSTVVTGSPEPADNFKGINLATAGAVLSIQATGLTALEEVNYDLHVVEFENFA
jgi:hypothetical protein